MARRRRREYPEEINRVLDPIAAAQNFGWPCYEGADQQGSYAASNLAICQGLYNAPGAVTPPFYAYNHSNHVVQGESCTIGSSSISGMAFYRGGSYSTAFDKALFFSDYSRKCIWVMFKDAQGDPDPSNIATFVPGAKGPVQLQIGPGGISSTWLLTKGRSGESATSAATSLQPRWYRPAR